MGVLRFRVGLIERGALREDLPCGCITGERAIHSPRGVLIGSRSDQSLIATVVKFSHLSRCKHGFEQILFSRVGAKVAEFRLGAAPSVPSLPGALLGLATAA